MATLGDRLGAAIGERARALAAGGASAPDAGARRLAARGRARGIGVVVAVAALAGAGVWWQGDGAIGPGPDPSPAIDGLATVTVPLDADAWNGSIDGTPFGCGKPVPEPNPGERGFTLDVRTEVKDGNGPWQPTITVELNHDGEIYDNALVSSPNAYVVQDGVVVGTIWPHLADFTGPVTRIGAQDRVSFFSFTAGDWGNAAFEECRPGVWQGERDSVLLAAGDYEIVVAQTVRHTPATTALIELNRAGYSLAGSTSGLWQPGSIDCRDIIADDIEYSENLIPVQCEPLGVQGIEIDAEAGTAALPYTEVAGPLDVDLVLASDPIPWRLDEDFTWSDLGYTVSEPVPLSELTCGELPVTANPPSLIAAVAEDFPEQLTTGVGGAMALDVNSVSRADRGTVTLGKTAPAVIFAWGEEGTTFYGTATATLSPHGDLDFDRAVDYVRLTVALSDVAVCDGADPFANKWHPTFSMVILASAVVTGEDGSRETADDIWVEFGNER